MKNRPKNHHIVPRAYLKRFTTDGEHAYVLRKPSNEIIGKPTNIRNLCVEKGFYSSYGRYGADEVWAETTLASLEDRISNWILPQIPPNLLFPCQVPALLRRTMSEQHYSQSRRLGSLNSALQHPKPRII